MAGEVSGSRRGGGVPVRLGPVGHAGEERVWLIAGIDVGPDYAAAVAAEGRGWRVSLADWRGEPVSVR